MSSARRWYDGSQSVSVYDMTVNRMVRTTVHAKEQKKEKRERKKGKKREKKRKKEREKRVQTPLGGQCTLRQGHE
jgi:hypothetical protein